MSLFSDILESIGSEKIPIPPQPKVPANKNSSGQPDLSKQAPRPILKPGLGGTAPSLSGSKRKADEDISRLPTSGIRRPPSPTLKQSEKDRQVAPPLSAPKLPVSNSESSKGRTTTPPILTGQVKAPSRGSFAEIMARAKAAQEQRGQTQIGMIKHQSGPKEKPSKLLERKKEEETRAKLQKHSLNPGPISSGRVEKRRSVSPAKKSQQPKAVRPSKPPLSAPKSSYRGTMGLQSKRSSTSRRNSQNRNASSYDEYLGTDEEEDSDVGDNNDPDDYVSEGSSDMEAGLDDLDEEEARALKAAREDDARELALERQLKSEKEERRRKLQSLADKRK